MTHENAPESTESDAGPESGPVSDGEAQDAREARYAEALDQHSIKTASTEWQRFILRVMDVADAELAPLRARVAELEAEVRGTREMALANDWFREVARLERNWKAAEADGKDWQNRAERAEAALARVEPLVKRWRTRMEGARQRANTGDDFAEIANVERVRRECADDLRSALAAAGPAVSDGEGATSEAGWVDRHGDVWREGDDGLMHSYETAPFSREHVERKWGPLRPASPVVAPSATDEGGLAAELRKAHAQNTERPDETKRRMPTLRPAEGGATE